MSTPDKLITAIRNDTAILTNIVGWLDSELQKIEASALALERTHEEWMLLKGEARCIRRLRDFLKKEARLKDAEEQPRNGAVRRDLQNRLR
jgi:hypothetical protein